MHKIFISYSRKDGRVARMIYTKLEQSGYSVSLDVSSLVAGEDWSKKVKSALSQSDIILILLSENLSSSTFATNEVQAALDTKKPLLVILLDDSAKQNWLWPLVATRKNIQLHENSADFDRQVDNLVLEIKTALSSHEKEYRNNLPYNKKPTLIIKIIKITLLFLSGAIGGLIAASLQLSDSMHAAIQKIIGIFQ